MRKAKSRYRKKKGNRYLIYFRKNSIIQIFEFMEAIKNTSDKELILPSEVVEEILKPLLKERSWLNGGRKN